MLIRKMTMEDIQQVAELETQCFSLPWTENSLKASLERNDTIFFVCEQQKDSAFHKTDMQKPLSIIGYIGMYTSFEEGEITNVAVAPQERRKGIGNLFLQAIKKEAQKQNLERIVLEVRISNKPAIALYQKNGFVSVGIRKKFYENPVEDAEIMICNL